MARAAAVVRRTHVPADADLRGGACSRAPMPRRLQFALGLVTLVALAAGIVRALSRHLPKGMERESYEALILVLAVALVVIIVRAARGYRSEQ